MKILKAELMDPKKLTPWDQNPRNNIKAVPEVMASIKKYGFINDIIVNQDLTICCGETRYKAAIEMGLKSVPVKVIKMTKEEFAGLNAADNKTGEIAKWDTKLLRDCMHILGELEAAKVPGFTTNDINSLFGHEATNESEQEPTDVIKKKILSFSPEDHKRVTEKLKAIKKEHNLNSEAETIIKVLEGYRAAAEPILQKGPTKVSNGE